MTYASSNRRGQAGSSLIEVMVALLILAILVIGTVASTARLGETVARQGHKRAAIAAAHRRMEEVRSVLYTHFSETENPADGIAIGGDWVFLSANTNRADATVPAFYRHGSAPGETVPVNGLPRAARTRVRFVDTSAGSFATAQCLEIEVSVATGAGDPVVLRSLYAN